MTNVGFNGVSQNLPRSGLIELPASWRNDFIGC